MSEKGATEFDVEGQEPMPGDVAGDDAAEASSAEEDQTAEEEPAVPGEVALLVYAAMTKRNLSCCWDGDCVVVEPDVRIAPPYKPQSCTAGPDRMSQTVLKRVHNVLALERASFQRAFSEPQRPTVIAVTKTKRDKRPRNHPPSILPQVPKSSAAPPIEKEPEVPTQPPGPPPAKMLEGAVMDRLGAALNVRANLEKESHGPLDVALSSPEEVDRDSEDDDDDDDDEEMPFVYDAAPDPQGNWENWDQENEQGPVSQVPEDEWEQLAASLDMEEEQLHGDLSCAAEYDAEQEELEGGAELDFDGLEFTEGMDAAEAQAFAELAGERMVLDGRHNGKGKKTGYAGLEEELQEEEMEDEEQADQFINTDTNFDDVDVERDVGNASLNPGDVPEHEKWGNSSEDGSRTNRQVAEASTPPREAASDSLLGHRRLQDASPLAQAASFKSSGAAPHLPVKASAPLLPVHSHGMAKAKPTAVKSASKAMTTSGSSAGPPEAALSMLPMQGASALLPPPPVPLRPPPKMPPLQQIQYKTLGAPQAKPPPPPMQKSAAPTSASAMGATFLQPLQNSIPLARPPMTAQQRQSHQELVWRQYLLRLSLQQAQSELAQISQAFGADQLPVVGAPPLPLQNVAVQQTALNLKQLILPYCPASAPVQADWGRWAAHAQVQSQVASLVNASVPSAFVPQPPMQPGVSAAVGNLLSGSLQGSASVPSTMMSVQSWLQNQGQWPGWVQPLQVKAPMKAPPKAPPLPPPEPETPPPPPEPEAPKPCEAPPAAPLQEDPPPAPSQGEPAPWEKLRTRVRSKAKAPETPPPPPESAGARGTEPPPPPELEVQASPVRPAPQEIPYTPLCASEDKQQLEAEAKESAAADAPIDSEADASDIARQIAEAFSFLADCDSEDGAETVATSVADDAVDEEPPLKRARVEGEEDVLVAESQEPHAAVTEQSSSSRAKVGMLPPLTDCTRCRRKGLPGVENAGVFCGRIAADGIFVGCGAALCWRCMRRGGDEQIGTLRTSKEECESLGGDAWWLHDYCMRESDRADYYGEQDPAIEAADEPEAGDDAEGDEPDTAAVAGDHAEGSFYAWE